MVKARLVFPSREVIPMIADRDWGVSERGGADLGKTPHT